MTAATPEVYSFLFRRLTVALLRFAIPSSNRFFHSFASLTMVLSCTGTLLSIPLQLSAHLSFETRFRSRQERGLGKRHLASLFP